MTKGFGGMSGNFGGCARHVDLTVGIPVASSRAWMASPRLESLNPERVIELHKSVTGRIIVLRSKFVVEYSL
jgi:hypothetical protein